MLWCTVWKTSKYFMCTKWCCNYPTSPPYTHTHTHMHKYKNTLSNIRPQFIAQEVACYNITTGSCTAGAGLNSLPLRGRTSLERSHRTSNHCVLSYCPIRKKRQIFKFLDALCCIEPKWGEILRLLYSPGKMSLNLLKPNDLYICRTAALTSRRFILNIYSTNIHTVYFKHAA